MNRIAWSLAVSCAVACAAGPARAEDAKPAADAGMDAAMAAMKERGTPGAAHQVFAPLAGAWTYTGQMWMDPKAPPEPMTGASTNVLINEGRFLKQEITGQIPNMPPFSGTGLLGYDNIRKEYQMVWYDNMSTGIMISTGQYDPAAKSITFKGDFSCPMTGEAHRQMRDVWTITDADHTVYESYMSGPDGKEFKSMEIQYTRAK